MSDCPVLSTCPFFADKLRNMPKTPNLLKDRYCRSRHAVCARWVVRDAAGPNQVPEDMFPHQADRANELLRRLGLEGLQSSFPDQLCLGARWAEEQRTILCATPAATLDA